MELFYLIALALIPIIAFSLINKNTKSNEEHVKNLCSQFNLKNDSTSYYAGCGQIKMSGKYMNTPLEIYQKAEMNGNKGIIYTIVEFTIKNPKLIELKIEPEFGKSMTNIPVVGEYVSKARENVKEFFNAKDISTGNEKIDNDDKITGKPEESVKELFDLRLMGAFKAFNEPVKIDYTTEIHSSHFELTVKFDKISFKRKDECPYFDKYTKIIFFLSELAYAIDEL